MFSPRCLKDPQSILEMDLKQQMAFFSKIGVLQASLVKFLLIKPKFCPCSATNWA